MHNISTLHRLTKISRSVISKYLKNNKHFKKVFKKNRVFYKTDLTEVEILDYFTQRKKKSKIGLKNALKTKTP